MVHASAALPNLIQRKTPGKHMDTVFGIVAAPVAYNTSYVNTTCSKLITMIFNKIEFLHETFDEE